VDPVGRPPARWHAVVNETVEQVFPLVATMVSVGVLVNILAATGVRGLIAISFVALPIIGIYATSLDGLPRSHRDRWVWQRGRPGTPLIFVFNAVGGNVTVVAAAFSMLFALGIACRLRASWAARRFETVGYRGSYTSFSQGDGRALGGEGIVALLDAGVSQQAGVSRRY